jgi:hypothetical protein
MGRNPHSQTQIRGEMRNRVMVGDHVAWNSEALTYQRSVCCSGG